MIEIQQEVPPIISLTLNTEVPFMVLSDGCTIELAIQGAIDKAIHYLKVFSQ